MSGWHIRDESQHRTALMHCCRDWPDSGGPPAQCTEQTMSGQGHSTSGVVETDVPDGVGPSVTSQAWPNELGWGKNWHPHQNHHTHKKKKRKKKEKRKKKTSTALPDFAWIELHQNILLIPHTWSRSLAKLVINAPPAQPKCSVGSGQRGLWRCGWCFTETVVTKDVFSLTVVRLVSKNSSLVAAATAVGEVTTLWLADLAIYILLSDCQQTQVQVQTDHQDS